MSAAGTVSIRFDVQGNEQLLTALNTAVTGMTKVSTASVKLQSSLGGLGVGNLSPLNNIATSVNNMGTGMTAAEAKVSSFKTKLAGIGSQLGQNATSFGVATASIWGVYNAYDSLEKVQIRAHSAAVRVQTLETTLASLTERRRIAVEKGNLTGEQMAVLNDRIRDTQEKLSVAMERSADVSQDVQEAWAGFISTVGPQAIAATGAVIQLANTFKGSFSNTGGIFNTLKNAIVQFIPPLRNAKAEALLLAPALGGIASGGTSIKNAISGLVSGISPLSLGLKTTKSEAMLLAPALDGIAKESKIMNTAMGVSKGEMILAGSGMASLGATATGIVPKLRAVGVAFKAMFIGGIGGPLAIIGGSLFGAGALQQLAGWGEMAKKNSAAQLAWLKNLGLSDDAIRGFLPVLEKFNSIFGLTTPTIEDLNAALHPMNTELTKVPPTMNAAATSTDAWVNMMIRALQSSDPSKIIEFNEAFKASGQSVERYQQILTEANRLMNAVNKTASQQTDIMGGTNRIWIQMKPSIAGFTGETAKFGDAAFNATKNTENWGGETEKFRQSMQLANKTTKDFTGEMLAQQPEVSKNVEDYKKLADGLKQYMDVSNASIGELENWKTTFDSTIGKIREQRMALADSEEFWKRLEQSTFDAAVADVKWVTAHTDVVKVIDQSRESQLALVQAQQAGVKSAQDFVTTTALGEVSLRTQNEALEVAIVKLNGQFPSGVEKSNANLKLFIQSLLGVKDAGQNFLKLIIGDFDALNKKLGEIFTGDKIGKALKDFSPFIKKMLDALPKNAEAEVQLKFKAPKLAEDAKTMVDQFVTVWTNQINGKIVWDDTWFSLKEGAVDKQIQILIDSIKKTLPKEVEKAGPWAAFLDDLKSAKNKKHSAEAIQELFSPENLSHLNLNSEQLAILLSKDIPLKEKEALLQGIADGQKSAPTIEVPAELAWQGFGTGVGAGGKITDMGAGIDAVFGDTTVKVPAELTLPPTPPALPFKEPIKVPAVLDYGPKGFPLDTPRDPKEYTKGKKNEFGGPKSRSSGLENKYGVDPKNFDESGNIWGSQPGDQYGDFYYKEPDYPFPHRPKPEDPNRKPGGSAFPASARMGGGGGTGQQGAYGGPGAAQNLIPKAPYSMPAPDMSKFFAAIDAGLKRVMDLGAIMSTLKMTLPGPDNTKFAPAIDAALTRVMFLQTFVNTAVMILAGPDNSKFAPAIDAALTRVMFLQTFVNTAAMILPGPDNSKFAPAIDAALTRATFLQQFVNALAMKIPAVDIKNVITGTDNSVKRALSMQNVFNTLKTTFPRPNIEAIIKAIDTAVKRVLDFQDTVNGLKLVLPGINIKNIEDSINSAQKKIDSLHGKSVENTITTHYESTGTPPKARGGIEYRENATNTTWGEAGPEIALFMPLTRAGQPRKGEYDIRIPSPTVDTSSMRNMLSRREAIPTGSRSEKSSPTMVNVTTQVYLFPGSQMLKQYVRQILVDDISRYMSA